VNARRRAPADPRARAAEICLALPEAVEERHGRHATYLVRRKKFAYYLDDHHGDGRLAVNCRAAPGENDAFVAEDPVRFYIPPYVGPRGWVGIYVDVDDVDWDELADLVTESYRSLAPKKLVAALDATAGGVTAP
jgi:hypothetical protein